MVIPCLVLCSDPKEAAMEGHGRSHKQHKALHWKYKLDQRRTEMIVFCWDMSQGPAEEEKETQEWPRTSVRRMEDFLFQNDSFHFGVLAPNKVIFAFR